VQGGVRHSLLQRLADVLGRSDGMATYDNWRAAMRRQMVQKTARKLLNHHNVDISEPVLQAFLLEQQNAIRVQSFAGVLKCMRGLLLADVVALFHHHGLDARSELLQEQWLDLPNDFTELLLWDFQVPVLNWLESLSKPADYRQCVVFLIPAQIEWPFCVRV